MAQYSYSITNKWVNGEYIINLTGGSHTAKQNIGVIITKNTQCNMISLKIKRKCILPKKVVTKHCRESWEKFIVWQE